MADERYEWLDEATAERLLRGGAGEGVPSGGVPGEGRGAAELAAALEELRSGSSSAASASASASASGAEFSGESDALAAFRESRCAASARRRSRWGRPLRLGLVTVLAAGALGGVAVAAGTGVLYGHFSFGPAEPEPASSVSVASPEVEESQDAGPESRKSPDPERKGTPEDRAKDGTPEPGEGDSSDGRRTSAGGSGASPDGSEPPGGGSKGTGADPGADPGTSPADPSGGKDPDTSQGTGDQGTPSKSWQQRTLKACRDYRANRLPDQVKQYLETQAKGSDGISRFCDRLLNGDGKGNGNGAAPPLPGGGNQGPGSGNGTGHGGGNGTGGKGENDGSGDDDSGDGDSGGRGKGRGGPNGKHRSAAVGPARSPVGSSAAGLVPARSAVVTPLVKLVPAQV
jgi:hypothetical protein